MNPDRHVVVVLGMHRGGTSAVARALPALGVPLGDVLLPPGSDNPKGFWEDREVFSINEELLAHLLSAYDRLGLVWEATEMDPAIGALQTRAVDLIKRRIAAHGGIWGFKDPRTSRLLPFWRETIRSSGCQESFVIALRNPLSVAISLEKRNNIPREKSCFLWLQHMLPAALNSSGAPRLVVDYDLLLDEPRNQLRRISESLRLGARELDSIAANEYSKGFLEQALRHTTCTVSNLRGDHRVPQDAAAAYELLLRAANDEISLDSPQLSRKLVNLKSRLVSYTAAFDYANQLEDDRTKLYRTVAESDARCSSLGQAVSARDGRLASLGEAVSERDARIASSDRTIGARDERIASLSQAIAQRNEQLASLMETVQRQDGRIASLDESIALRDAWIDRVTTARDEQIASLTAAISVRDKQVTSIIHAVGERDRQIELLRGEIASLDTRIIAQNRTIEADKDRNTSLQTTLSERDEQIASLNQALSERIQQHAALNRDVASLQQTSDDRAAQIASINQGIAERDGRIAFLEQAMAERDARIESLTVIVAERENQIVHFRRRESDVKASMSWRVTAPLRYVYARLLSLSKTVDDRFSKRVRTPGVAPTSQTSDRRANLPKPLQVERDRPSGDYVEDTPPPSGFDPDVRVIAFYLPQFHPIPENDEWWGKGFTEWSNVVRATPQFKDHYQPHLPGELGFYDLRVKEVQKRQVELAQRYGIGAFCFYFYWFGKKTLLESPLRQYLENAELSLPFCLCWANESWTRRWDGEDEDVLIAQNHAPSDDIPFIKHVSQYMRDPRYLRINGRPVLLVYRPSLLSDARATASRWRKWAKQNGLGDLYLVYPQSFEVRDPKEYGFDAATEFPPNLSDPPILTEQIQRHNPDFSGIAYDWRALVERSRQYPRPNYKLFRGVCPSWDNESRRPRRGSIFVHSNPDGYREWLKNALADTRRRFEGDERVVFVNAWNEWAEGAHLEPDQRYGYAWLNSTREALLDTEHAEADSLARIVVVTHDAYPHGAQFIALNIVRELIHSLHCAVEVVCLGEGPLRTEFAKHARVHDLAGADLQGPEARRLSADLFERGFRHAFVNTTVSGPFLGTLKHAGLNCVALVHELRELILSYDLRTHAQCLAEHADRVVFPATEVAEAFREFASIDPGKAVVRPQGLLKRNSYDSNDPKTRRELRKKLGLADDSRIVLGVGYGDRRKGIDHFQEIAAAVIKKDSSVHFIWVGDYVSDTQLPLARLAEQRPDVASQIHFVGHQGDTALYYAGADVFALTSREDPFPCVVLEAMDAGLPVVAFEGSGGSNKLISEGLGENVPMGDCMAFEAAILALLENKARRESIARCERALIAERFSFRHYVFDLLALADVPVRKVSVIVPNFNYEHYLSDRIATILNQTYPIYEIIFLDDASNDNSVALADRLLAPSGIDYRIITNQVNSGSVSLQWKLGTERARGDIVWIAEADDLSQPEFLATVIRGFDEPGVVLSYCSSKQIDRDGGVLADDYGEYLADLGHERWRRPYFNDGEDEIRSYLAVKNTIPNVSAVLMKRPELERVLEEHIQDIKSHRVAGDWKTYLYLLSKGRVAFSPRSLNLHRRHGRGITMSSFNESHFREIREIQAWVEQRHPLSNHVSQSMQHYLNVLSEQFGLDHHEG